MHVSIETIGSYVDIAGVAIMLIGLIAATLRFAFAFRSGDAAFSPYRRDIGRAILLGLEVLVAGDIIKTVGHRADPAQRRRPRRRGSDPNGPQL
jgi:uncharacterized membrane protein